MYPPLAWDVAGTSESYYLALLTCITMIFTNSMATTKLRKTFKYPADDSEEDDSPQALDEEGMPKACWQVIGGAMANRHIL